MFVWKNLGQENHAKSRDYRVVIIFKLVRFQIVLLLSTQKRKARVFKFLRFEERFRKIPFSLRISVDGSPKRRNKIRN